MDWNFLIKPNNKLVDALNICTDSRHIARGCAYFALRGERFDGNDFALDALQKGAQWVIVDNNRIFQNLPKHAAILVDNTLTALQDLARTWRQTLNIPIFAITGTNGKTTTKELIAAVLSKKYDIQYTKDNINNHIGVPLTLLQITHHHQCAIIEMGASHPGDIRELVEIALPTMGLITNIGLAHLEFFKSVEGVMQTKKELYDFLYEHNGIIFRNVDNPLLQQIDASAYGSYPTTSTTTIPYHTGQLPQYTHLVGEYNAENIAAAIAVGQYFNIDQASIDEAIAAYQPNNMRSQEKYTTRNHLIVDTYNANPTSMQAAIACFKGDTLILGDMRELGEYSHIAHQNIVNTLLEKKYQTVYLIGEAWKTTTSPYRIFDNVQALQHFTKENPFSNQYILIKGSHANHLEDIVEYL